MTHGNFTPRETVGELDRDHVPATSRAMARSAIAVMVRLGLTPRLAGTAAPSTTYSPGTSWHSWLKSTTEV